MSFISVLFPSTGDYLRVADPKTQAGQAAWERATDVAIQFAQKPSEALAAKLLAIVGQRSSLPGDPTSEGWLPGLAAGQRAVALEQLQQLVGQWHLEHGRQVDGSANPTIEGVVTMSAQGQAIVSRPTTKASTAEALRLAAQDAGPQRGELLARAAVAQQEAEREAADLAKAAASRRRTTPAARGPHRLEPEDAAEALRILARYRSRLASEAEAAGAPQAEVDALRGKAATPTADLVPTEELYVRDAPAMLFKRAGRAR